MIQTDLLEASWMIFAGQICSWPPSRRKRMMKVKLGEGGMRHILILWRRREGGYGRPGQAVGWPAPSGPDSDRSIGPERM